MAYTTSVFVSYRFFTLLDEGQELPSLPPFGSFGLASVGDGAAQVFAGTHTGTVTVTVDVRDEPPADTDTDPWDDIVDVSLHAPTGHVRLLSWQGTPPEPDIPELTRHGPGDYRLRIAVRDRDPGECRDATDPDEEFLITVWPAPAAPDFVHKLTDRVGARYRAEAEQARADAAQVAALTDDELEAQRRAATEQYRQSVARVVDRHRSEWETEHRTLGPDDPRTLGSRILLARDLAVLEQWAESADHFRAVLAVYERRHQRPQSYPRLRRELAQVRQHLDEATP